MSKGGAQVSTQSGRQSQTNTLSGSNAFNNQQMLDPRSQAYIDQQRGLASQGTRAILGTGPLYQGPNQYMQSALDQLLRSTQGGSGGGGVGMVAPDIGGFGGEVSQLMNPYNQQVIDATRREFDVMRQGATTAAGQAAARGGAFGGSRQAVLEAQLLGDLNRQQGSQVANLLQGGYSQAAQNALALRGQGLQAATNQAGAAAGGQASDLARLQTLFGLGNQFRDVQQQQAYDPITRYQQALGLSNLGMGPTGWQQSGTSSQNQTGTQTGTFSNQYRQPTQSNPLGGALGGASIGSQFGPWGAAIGGGLGLLGSLL